PCFFFSSRRRHTRWPRDWSSDVCSSDLNGIERLDPVRDERDVLRVDPLDLDHPPPILARHRDHDAAPPRDQPPVQEPPQRVALRSEERRVGKEGRARGWVYV